jgi:hypothetical protein
MLTLHEAAKLVDNDLKRQAIIEMFAQSSDIVGALPLMDIPGNSYSYAQEAKLPSVGFRGYNEGYTSSFGVINPQTETLRIAGGELDVDTALVKTHGEQVRSRHESMQVKALGLKIADAFINGNSQVDSVSIDGLRARITGTQLLPANEGAPNANSPLSLGQLDNAIDAVDGPTHIVMSKRMRNKLSQAAKDRDVGGELHFQKDDFGRRVAFYNDLPILVADTNHLGQYIIDFNEAGPAGGTTCSSIYVVSFGEGKVCGLQNGIMDVRDLGEIDALPVFRTRVEWLVAMAVMHGRAAARIWGITNAAVTR